MKQKMCFKFYFSRFPSANLHQKLHIFKAVSYTFQPKPPCQHQSLSSAPWFTAKKLSTSNTWKGKRRNPIVQPKQLKLWKPTKPKALQTSGKAMMEVMKGGEKERWPACLKARGGKWRGSPAKTRKGQRVNQGGRACNTISLSLLHLKRSLLFSSNN